MAPEKFNLDDIFRKKLNGELPDDKVSWNAVNDLLDKQEKNKRKKRFIWLFSILALLTLSTAIYFNGQKKNGRSNQSARNIENKSSENNSFQNQATQQKATTTGINEIVKQKNSAGDLPEPLPSYQDPKGADIKNNPVAKKDTKTLSNAAFEKSASATNSVSKNKEHGIAGAYLKEETISEAEKKQSEENSFKAEINNQPNINSESTTAAPGEEAQKINTIDSSTITGDSIAKDSSEIQAKADSAMNDPAKEKPKTLDAYILAGAGYNITPQSITPIIGISVDKKFNKKFSADFSIYYSELSGLDLKDSSVQISYFLDKETSKESLVIEKVNMINVPLWLHYHASSKNSFLLGINFYYLLDSRSSYVLSENSGSTILKKEENTHGYMDGLTPFNYAIQAGYIFSFSQKMEAEMIYQKSISNPIDREYFGETKKYFDSSLFVFIRFKFY